MSTSRSKKKGIFPLFALVIIIGMLLLISGIFFGPRFANYLFGIKSTVKLTVDVDDQGSALNSFLKTSAYEEFMSLGNDQLDGSELQSVLEALKWSLVVLDENGKSMKEFGVVREERAKFVPLPLPGLKRGRLGIDRE